MIENITAVVTSFLEYIARLARWKKKLIVFLLDILLCVQSIWIAYSLRIGVWILWDIAVQKIVLACLLIMVPVFVLTGVYQAIFRYAGTGRRATHDRRHPTGDILHFGRLHESCRTISDD